MVHHHSVTIVTPLFKERIWVFADFRKAPIEGSWRHRRLRGGFISYTAYQVHLLSIHVLRLFRVIYQVSNCRLRHVSDTSPFYRLFRTYVLPDEIYPLQFRYKPHSDFPLFQALRFCGKLFKFHTACNITSFSSIAVLSSTAKYLLYTSFFGDVISWAN